MYEQKQTNRAKILSWLPRNKRLLLFIAAILVIVGAGTVVLAIIGHQPAEPAQVAARVIEPVAAPEPEPVKYYSPLTGVPVPDETATKRQVTAVIIENSPQARPQSGLQDAGVVYEAIAEGGITRFVALYQEARPGLVGPVRSVRPYFVEWAAAYDPAMAHVGGSSKALQMIRSGEYGKDIDQFFNSGAYYRSTDRYAPHNVYTTFDRLDALNQAKGNISSAFESLPRKKDEPSPIKDATSISISVSSQTYSVGYTYDVNNNTYLRVMAGAQHVDRESKAQLTAKNVAVIKVSTVRAMEDGYREQMTTIGSGEASVFMDGRVIPAVWEKTAAKSPLLFKDMSGKVIEFNRGSTWITAIPTNKGVTWQ